MKKAAFLLVFAIVFHPNAGRAQVIDSFSYELVKNYADTSSTAPINTMLNGIPVEELLMSLFPKLFSFKNRYRTEQKYTQAGAMNIHPKNRKSFVRVYEESGTYVKVAKYPLGKRPYLKTQKAEFFTESGVVLGMRKAQLFSSHPQNLFYCKATENKKESFYYCWHDPDDSCIDERIPYLLGCLPYFAEYHFENDKLIMFGYGFTRQIPTW